jgi:membrane protease YdiL (CAAX protease family)
VSLKRRRWLELVALFILAPLVLSRAPRVFVLPGIVAGGVFCLVALLVDRSFPRRHLWDAAAARRGIGRVLLRTALVWAGLLVFAFASYGREGVFAFPRARPVVWAIVVVLYPFFSAYPQEVMYRTFFFHRYGELFRRPAARVVTNAVVFGWAHIIVHNWTAVLLATVGGLLFASTYEASRSTLLVSAEHALYGDFVFSAGLGGMFVTGVRLASAMVR